MFQSKIVLIIMLFALLAACAPAAPAVTETPSPIVTEVPTFGSVAVVKSVDVLLLESFPLQVNVVIRGDLPDAGCTTIASVEQVREGNTFTLTLVTTTDPLALCAQALTPFEEVVSLDVQGLPAGIYTVDVHGVQQTFEFTVDNSAEEDNLIAVEHVEVQVGVGSPIPVEIVASGTWPDLCAQIAEVKSEIDGFQIDVTLLASKSESCPPDHLGLPFRFALPLNIVEMPDGVYTITVNGTSTTFMLPISQ